MFDFICEECGKGTVKSKEFSNFEVKIKGYPFVIDKAVVGVCDRCGARHYSADETKRWEKLFEEHVKSDGVFLTPDEIDELRKELGISIEDFAYLIGSTRQSIHNWIRESRTAPQSRIADLSMRLVRQSLLHGKVDVIDFLTNEARKLKINLKPKRRVMETSWQLKKEGSDRSVKNAATKHEIIKYAQEYMKSKTGSVRIHKDHRTIQEERTHPRKSDPKKSKG